MHEQPARAGAALAGGTDRAKDDRRDRQFQVGAVIDDDRVVAAQFQQRAPQAPRNALADHAADLGRTGEADQADALVVDEAGGQLGAGIVEQEKDVGEPAGLECLVADLHRRDRRQRGLRRRFPDRDVAADRSDEAVPRPHRDGEVERGNHTHDPERMPLLVHAVAGAFGVHGQAIQLARQTDGELADVDHLLHFAVALGLGLAHLQRDQRTQRVLVRTQRIGAQADRLATARRRGRAPYLEGGLRALDDGVVVGLRGRLHPRQQLAVARVDRLQHPGIAGVRPLAAAKVGAGFGGVQTQGGEYGMNHC